jgi:hypothetical protein
MTHTRALITAAVAIACVPACSGAKSVTTASSASTASTVSAAPASGGVEGPTLPAAPTAMSPATTGVTLVAYFRSDATDHDLSQYLQDQTDQEDAALRAGQHPVVPQSAGLDLANRAIRYTMFATATPDDVASFKAELLRNPMIVRVA